MNTQRLLQYLAAPDQHPAVETHVQTCPTCQAKLAQFAQAARSSHVDRLTCDECLADLPSYVQVEAEGGDPTQRFPEVQNHLALCPHCQNHYQALLEIETALVAEPLPATEIYPAPDLSFLRPSGALEKLGDVVRRGAFWAQRRTRALVLDMQGFLQSMGQPAFPAPAVRGETSEPQGLVYQIALGPESLNDLDIEVTVHRQPEKPGLARVVVYVRVPSRLLEGFAGSQVQLKLGKATQLAQADDDGRVSFEDVPLGELQVATFEISPIQPLDSQSIADE